MAKFGIVFDCDGTLLDTIGMWHEVEDELYRRAGAEPTPADHAVLVSLTVPETGAFFHDRYGLGASGDDVVSLMSEILLAYYQTKARPRNGALEFVQELAQAGVPMSVASSSPQEFLQAGLGIAGFLPYLRKVVSVDDVGSSKREPAVYDCARDALGFDRAHTWGFEDSLYAVQTLKRAGYPVVGIYDCDESGAYSDLCAAADVCIRDFSEITFERLSAL